MKNPAKYSKQADLLAAIEDANLGISNPGFCLACGEEAGGCEPDAREYACECCGEMEVYGAEEVLMIGAFR